MKHPNSKISVSDFNGLLSSICRDIFISGWKPDYVVGIDADGTIPAIMMSKYLDVPSYMINVSEQESNCWMADDAVGGKNILLVLDYVDNHAANALQWLTKDWQSLSSLGEWDEIWNNNVRLAAVVNNTYHNTDLSVFYSGDEISDDEFQKIELPYYKWWSE